MNTKNALITGATSGIGQEISRHLLFLGYRLVVLARSKSKYNELADLIDPDRKGSMLFVPCDLASFSSVEEAGDKISNTLESIDVLILNAGLWNFKQKMSKDGIEETFQVNLLSHVQLFQKIERLIPRNGLSKVILTSSALHTGEINFKDPEYKVKFSGFQTYRQSKLGMLLFTKWLNAQEQFKGIHFFAVHPGVVNTDLGRDAGWFSRMIFSLIGVSKRKGAETHCYLIQESVEKLKSGAYYAKSKVKASTAYSNELKNANKLMELVFSYLQKMIPTSHTAI